MGWMDELMVGAGFSCTPERRALLLALAQGDGQPWTADQAESGWTDHMAEIMYGKDADRLEQRTCHCGEPLAVVSVPETAEFGPPPWGLCVYCLPVRCDLALHQCRHGGNDPKRKECRP